MAKEFVLTDESLNEYGFWLPMNGAVTDTFKKNPILLWMHNRAWRGTKDDVLPLGTIENFRIEGDKMLGSPRFDQKDDFALAIENKVEDDIIRMASVGIRIIETSSDPKWLKPGQTRETPIKWVLKEVSLVDIGANSNSLAIALYDENDQLIKLADDGGNLPIKPLDNSNDNNHQTNLSMKKLLSFFKLADGATEEEVLSKVEELSGQITALSSEKATLEGELKTLKDAQVAAREAEIVALLDAAVKDGRIDEKAKESWKNLFSGNFEAAKSTLQSIAPRKPLKEQFSADGNKSEEEILEKLSWDEMDKQGILETVKLNYPELFVEKFKKKFGREPKA